MHYIVCRVVVVAVAVDVVPTFCVLGLFLACISKAYVQVYFTASIWFEVYLLSFIGPAHNRLPSGAMSSSAKLENTKIQAIGGVATPAVGGEAKKGYSESTNKALMSLLACHTFYRTWKLEAAVGGATVSTTRKLEAAVGRATSSTDQEEDSQAGEEPLKKRHKGCRQNPNMMTPVPPGRPPPPPPDPFAVGSLRDFPGGFWFGIDYQMDIEGPDVRGRFIHAKNELQRSGELTPLPYVFHPAVGGHASGKAHQVCNWRNKCIDFVMSLVQRHEGEYRRWHFMWKDRMPELVHSDEYDGWQGFRPGPQPAIGGFLMHHRLQRPCQLPSMDSMDPDLQIISGPDSTIVRRWVGSCQVRNIFITSLPEILLLHLNAFTAEQVHQEWKQCEVIIGKSL